MGNSPFGLRPWKSLHPLGLDRAALHDCELLHTSFFLASYGRLSRMRSSRFRCSGGCTSRATSAQCRACRRMITPWKNSLAPARRPLKPHGGGRKGLLDRLLNPIEDADGQGGDNRRRDAGQQKGFHDSSPQRVEIGDLQKSCGRECTIPSAASWPYSAAVAAGCGRASLAPVRAFSSSSQSLWCSFAQLISTVPLPIASKAPSMPMVPM